MARVVSLTGLEQPERALEVLFALTKRLNVEFGVRYILERLQTCWASALVRRVSHPLDDS